MFTHANISQKIRSQSPSLWLTFQVLNTPSFSCTKPKVKILATVSQFYSISDFTPHFPSLDDELPGWVLKCHMNGIDVSSSNHKVNAVNILVMYTPQISSQNLRVSPNFKLFDRGLTCQTVPGAFYFARSR